jgi:NAD(P)-dependent dehydrogenase (short-subunit alcohol dehydrogenase family)
MKLFDLSGEVVVCVGTSGALGSAFADGFGEAGAKVAVVSRRLEAAESRAKEINARGGTAKAFQADALEKESLEKARDAIVSSLGNPTVLLNVAGGNNPETTVTPEHPFESIALEDWKRNFDLNLVAGVLLPCQVFGPGMVARGKGSIINTASVTAHIPLSRVVSYSAAKAGVLSLTKFLAREWGSKGVRVNSITPGFFPAQQNRALLFNPDGSPTERTRQILGHTPMRRFGEPSELVGAAIFLASDKASGFITGADICVDGGFLAQTI